MRTLHSADRKSAKRRRHLVFGRSSKGLNPELPHDAATLLLGTSVREMQTEAHAKYCS